MSNDKLVITYITQDNRISELDDPFCDLKLEIEVDLADKSSHQLMAVFAKVLAAIGYNEFSIMKGACSLAFNEMRDTEMMYKLVKEYELDEIPEDCKVQQERKKMHESVNYSSKDNDGYEPS